MPSEQLKPCPFCNAHAVETANGYAVHHMAGCILSRLYGSTYMEGHDREQWNTRAAQPVAVSEEILKDLRWIAERSRCPVSSDKAETILAAFAGE
jgi:hypothetical protein